MRKASALELRAYVDFDGAILEQTASLNTQGLSEYTLSIKFVNFGKTPAFKFKLKFMATQTRSKPSVASLRTFPWESVGSIAPGDHFFRKVRMAMNQQDVLALTSGSRKVRILGVGIYKDHLGVLHWLPVRLESDKTLAMVVW
jgi:hypothetical protein